MRDEPPVLRLTDLLGPQSDWAVREVERRCRFFVRRQYSASPVARHLEDDIVQEALAAAFGQARKIEEGAEDIANVNGWLCRVTVNAVRRTWRRERKSTESEPLDAQLDVAAPRPISLEKRLALRRALARLDPQCRQLLLLRDVLEEERQDMAERLGITSNALGVRLHRCRRRLLELYEAA